MVASRLAFAAGMSVAACWPVQAADLANTDLLGCWRDVEDVSEQLAAGAELRPDGYGEGILVYDIEDLFTGQQLRGSVAYDEICFSPDGTVETMDTAFDEGRGAGGVYTYDGRMLTVREEQQSDGWLFRSPVASCAVTIGADQLSLNYCSGDDEGAYAMVFARTSKR